MSDAPFIRSNDGERKGITEGGDGKDVAVANELLAEVVGKLLLQFRMGYGVHLELGAEHEVTIETPFEVLDGETRWAGEPLTAEAAGAILSLNQREVTASRIELDGTLHLSFGAAILTVPPASMYEAWQLRGPGGLLIVCSPGGDYVAVWTPEERKYGRQVRTLGWPYPLGAQAWADLRDEYLSSVDSRPGLVVMAEIVDSVIDGGAADLLAATTSMRDLIVVPCPTPEPPFDVIAVRAPRFAAGDTIVIEHLAVTGRNDRLERPVDDAVRLFWRFVREKFGIKAPGWPGP